MRRPKSVTVLALLVLSLTAFYILRLIQGLAQWQFLQSLPLIVPPAYIVISGLLWTIVGLPLALALWIGRPGAPRAARWTALLFSLYYWLDRLFVAAPAAGRSNGLFRLAITVLIAGYLFWTLSRPAAQVFFKERRADQAA